MTATPVRHSNFTLAAFAGPCLPMAALGLPLVLNLPTFYAQSMGLSLDVVGYIFLAVRLIDISFDPILGSLMDRTRTRIGRFRPWRQGAAILPAKPLAKPPAPLLGGRLPADASAGLSMGA